MADWSYRRAQIENSRVNPCKGIVEFETYAVIPLEQNSNIFLFAIDVKELGEKVK
jgi:hypothetical protein